MNPERTWRRRYPPTREKWLARQRRRQAARYTVRWLMAMMADATIKLLYGA